MKKKLFFLFLTLFTDCIACTCNYQQLYSLNEVMEEEDENQEEDFHENLTEKQIQQNPYPH